MILIAVIAWPSSSKTPNITVTANPPPIVPTAPTAAVSLPVESLPPIVTTTRQSPRKHRPSNRQAETERERQSGTEHRSAFGPQMVKRVLAIVLFVSAPALASDEIEGQAQRLFDEGRMLRTAGRTAEACERFAASEKLSRAGGTIINLAECWLKLGRTASAYGRFREAANLAHAAGKSDIEAMANGRADSIAKDLPMLEIALDGDASMKCPMPDRCTDSMAVARGGDAKSLANAATGTFVAGAALAAIGLGIAFAWPRGGESK